MLAAAPAFGGDLPPGGSFVDDDGNVHEGTIEAIFAEGHTRGCNPPANDRYCPARTLTRGELAAFVSRARSLPAATTDWFVDDDGSIFEGDINRLREAGITKGCNPPANDRYCPGRTLTRGELAALFVRAYGYTDAGSGDFFVDDDGSIFEDSIDRLREAGVTKGCNPPANDRFCPNDLVRRDEFASFLSRAEGLTPMVPPPRPVAALTTIASGLDSPVHLTSPPGDGRIFIVERGGRIVIFEDGAVQPGAFLDITSDTDTRGEQGLLSMAFHPNYATNGKFYVYQSRSQTSYVDEYTVGADPDDADESSRRNILSLAQPAQNHNGGQIEFGPDGYLWIAFGDGGGANDEFGHGQDISTLHGAILRIDVDSSGKYDIPADNPFVGKAGRDEIWAYGLRNPWRFAFHGRQLYIADVGQGAREEVDVLSIDDDAGANLGWCDWEGSLVHPGDNCTAGGAHGTVFPVLELTHGAGNCSITGGRVYEGSELPDLVGHYFYVDLCRGHLSSFELVGGWATNEKDWTGELGLQSGVWSFGSDSAGNLYVIFGGGTVERLGAA